MSDNDFQRQLDIQIYHVGIFHFVRQLEATGQRFVLRHPPDWFVIFGVNILWNISFNTTKEISLKLWKTTHWWRMVFLGKGLLSSHSLQWMILDWSGRKEQLIWNQSCFGYLNRPKILISIFNDKLMLKLGFDWWVPQKYWRDRILLDIAGVKGTPLITHAATKNSVWTIHSFFSWYKFTCHAHEYFSLYLLVIIYYGSSNITSYEAWTLTRTPDMTLT